MYMYVTVVTKPAVTGHTDKPATASCKERSSCIRTYISSCSFFSRSLITVRVAAAVIYNEHRSINYCLGGACMRGGKKEKKERKMV